MYDVIVIGGGPGGYTAAERAAEGGFNTLLIEKDKLGGVCLNEGCIPSKSLIHSAHVLNSAKEAKQYGVNIEGSISPDQKRIVGCKDRVVRRLTQGIAFSLKQRKVEIMYGEAVIAGKSTEGISVAINGENVLGKKLVIATGSSVVIPKIKGAEGSPLIITSKEALSLSDIPEKLVVVGGGVVGLELAAYYSAVGSKVVVVEATDRIASAFDSEATAILQKTMEKSGVEFLLGSLVTEITSDGIIITKDGIEERINCDKVLLAVGRRANSMGLNLSSIGVTEDKGKIICDKKMRTAAENVYCVGDANGISMLAHTAYREAEVAVNDMLGISDEMDYTAVPSVIYTSPELAFVGETEESARAKGLDITVKKLPMSFSGRFVAENGYAEGLCKLILKGDTLIGAHLVGSYSSEIIVALATFIGLKLDIRQIKKIVFPHPTIGEVVHSCLYI